MRDILYRRFFGLYSCVKLWYTRENGGVSMAFLRKILCLAGCCMLLLPIPVRGEARGTDNILRDLIGYYFHYREQAGREIENQLEILSDLDPQQGSDWTRIMERWVWTNEEMEITPDVLPEGLPQDDSLCVVVLGYGLNKDGSMKEELVSRLEVALKSAEKYPQAYVLCTGGETANVPGISEAGQMGRWLVDQGLEKDRLLLETDSLSTTENARNCLRLLRRDYPQVNTLAIVSSDYHIPWGSILFAAEAILQEDDLEVAANAACVTEKSGTDTMYSQAWGLSILAGVPFEGSYVPTLYMQEDVPPTETPPVPMPAEAPAQAEEKAEEPVLPVLLGLAAVLAILFLPKKKRSGSD